MTEAFAWVISTIAQLITGLNLAVTVGDFTFHLLDFIVALAILGLLYRNFIHSAR